MKLAIFSSARSDFGILNSLIIRLKDDKRFKPYLIVGGAHTSKIFGNTIEEIEKIRIKKIFLKFKYSNSKEYNILKSAELTLQKSNKILKKNKFDGAIILGDRYETMLFSFCCLFYKIPIIHLSGGSITEGSIDDIFRFSISKMAKIHLIETDFHKKNLLKIGLKKNLYVVGSPALENINYKFKNIQLSFDEKKFLNEKKEKKIIACFHPETTKSLKENLYNLKILIKFLNSKKHKITFTFPNADEGFGEIIKIIKKELKKGSLIIPSLGIKKYHFFLKKCDLLIGNSSSGIVESCSFKIPCLNIGDRQKGRFAPSNVLHTNFKIKDINQKYKTALSKKFRKKIKKIVNPYEKKHTSQKICNYIYSNLKNVQK